MKHIKRATKQASCSSFTRARVGAILVKGGRVLSSGYNQLRYTKRNGRSWPSVHAEEAAILRLLRQPCGLQQLAGATLYVSRIKKDGSTACALPCPDCTRLIQSVGIRKVIHT